MDIDVDATARPYVNFNLGHTNNSRGTSWIDGTRDCRTQRVRHCFIQMHFAFNWSQYRMLQDLEGNVDKTETKLGGAMKKMQKFIRDTEGETAT